MRTKNVITLLLALACLGALLLDSPRQRNRDALFTEQPESFSAKLQTIEDRLVKLGREAAELRPRVKFAEPIERAPAHKTKLLSVQGIRRWTNHFRRENGLPELGSEALLQDESEAKIDDMLRQDYFAHESPQGLAPGEQLEQTMQEYLLIGENLAKGGFSSDRDLVEAWMASPGHRKNILHAGYRGIGIDVRQQERSGKTVWFAVQTFGTSKSECPLPSDRLLVRIESDRDKMDQIHEELEFYMEKIENPGRLSARGINLLIEEYNDNVRAYNRLNSIAQPLAAQYREQVETYNNCIHELAGD